MPKLAALFVLSLLAACAGERPDTTVSPQLDSGIASSNGGGVRALGGVPNVGVATRAGPAR